MMKSTAHIVDRGNEKGRRHTMVVKVPVPSTLKDYVHDV